MFLGSEIMAWCDENAELHQENYDLFNDFKKVTKIVKPFIIPYMSFISKCLVVSR